VMARGTVRNSKVDAQCVVGSLDFLPY
jgi:hypothetical protein